MRKKSIRKNKSNRKKINRKKSNRKKSIHKNKTNRKRTNHKKTKHKKTYLKKRNIQRGGDKMTFVEFGEFFDEIITKDFSNYYGELGTSIDMLKRKVFSDVDKDDREKIAAFEKLIQNLIDRLNGDNYRTLIIFILQLVKGIVGEFEDEILIEPLKKFFDSEKFQALDISKKKGSDLHSEIKQYDYQEEEAQKKHMKFWADDILPATHEFIYDDDGGDDEFVNDDDEFVNDDDDGDDVFNTWDDPEVLLEEIEEKKGQLRLAAELGQTLVAKNEELQEESERLEETIEGLEAGKEELEGRVEELEGGVEELEKQNERLNSSLTESEAKRETESLEANEKVEDHKQELEDEKSKNAKMLKDILESVNQLGLVTQGELYTKETNTENIEGTLIDMAGAVEYQIEQQINSRVSEANETLMRAAGEQAELNERIEELEKEVEQTRETRDEEKGKNKTAQELLEKSRITIDELISRNQEVVRGYVAGKEALRQQNRLYESENNVYRENNAELKSQNEKLSIDLAKKEDCIEKTRKALGDNESKDLDGKFSTFDDLGEEFWIQLAKAEAELDS